MKVCDIDRKEPAYAVSIAVESASPVQAELCEGCIKEILEFVQTKGMPFATGREEAQKKPSGWGKFFRGAAKEINKMGDSVNKHGDEWMFGTPKKKKEAEA